MCIPEKNKFCSYMYVKFPVSLLFSVQGLPYYHMNYFICHTVSKKVK